MTERQTLIIYPWSMSVTGIWSPESGIYKLRDMSPEELVDLLWEPGISIQNSAIIEIMAHGNQRKAAEVARALIEKHPIVEKSIKERFGEAFGDFLLKTPLEYIPSKPEEYPPNVDIQLVQ